MAEPAFFFQPPTPSARQMRWRSLEIAMKSSPPVSDFFGCGMRQKAMERGRGGESPPVLSGEGISERRKESCSARSLTHVRFDSRGMLFDSMEEYWDWKIWRFFGARHADSSISSSSITCLNSMSSMFFSFWLRRREDTTSLFWN